MRRVLRKGEFAHAVFTALPDGRVGCLFEADGYMRIAFARFSMDSLRDNAVE